MALKPGKKDELILKTVHDLCNILMVISGNAQLCLMEDLQDENIKKQLEIIVGQSDKAKKMLEGIALNLKHTASQENQKSNQLKQQ